LSLLSATLFSCSNEEKVEATVNENQNTLNRSFCSFEMPSTITNPSGRGSIWTYDSDVKWANGTVIKIKFLNENSANLDLRVKIKRYARIWLRHVNLNYEFVPTTADADIKINPSMTDIGWNSKFGRFCQYVPQNSASMNISNSTDESFLRSQVLHEFGHALGMIHEQLSPNCNQTNWNKDLIRSNRSYWGWSVADFNAAFFNQESSSNTYLVSSTYDRNSIMHYWLLAGESGPGSTANDTSNLTNTDISFMNGQYPLGNTRNIYRFNYNFVHNYNPNVNHRPELYTEGVLGRISMSQIPNSFPLRRFERSNGDSYFTFATAMPNNPEYTFKELIGYAFKTQQPGTVAIHQYWGNNHHFYTANFNELGNGGSGYVKEPTFIYLFP
jgi:serralysin